MNEFDTYKAGKFLVHGNGITETHENEVIIWRKNDEIHRDGDKPASITSYSQAWYQNGKLHRDNDSPARISETSKAWYKHGCLHRENGPAFIRANGSEQWWLNDETLNETEIQALKLKTELVDKLSNNNYTIKKNKI